MIQIQLPKVSLKLTVDNLTINRNKIDERCGIYYLYDRDHCLLYVGQAKNLYARLIQHRSGHSNSRTFYEDIAYIDVTFVDCEYEREIYETHAIHTLRPSCNRSKVFGRGKSEDELIAEERIHELRDERRMLVSEILQLRESFGDAEYFAESEIDSDDLADWGTILHNEKLIAEIDAEISELKRVK